jgi:hypothetical protein
MAVGEYRTSGGFFPLAEQWDGNSWTIVPAHFPSGGGFTGLTGVSCTATNACTAVGTYVAGATTTMFAERWNGSSWSLQSTATPTGNVKGSWLNGVACTGASACFAVGYYQVSSPFGVLSPPLAEPWNGTSWSVGTAVSPTNSLSAGLDAVSCSSSNACTAVGAVSSATHGPQAGAQRWNGSTWSLQAPVNPFGSDQHSFWGVSCPSTNSCTAVGNHAPIGGSIGSLAEQWNGSGWSNKATPAISGSTLTDLLGVSCTSSSACMAVGYYYLPAAQSTFTLAERWNGSSWTTQPPLNVAITTFTNGTVSIADTLPSAGTLSGAASSAGPPAAFDVATIASRASRAFLVSRAHVKVKRAGLVRLKFLPDSRALRYLRAHHKLRASVVLKFKPKHGKTITSRLSVTLRYSRARHK